MTIISRALLLTIVGCIAALAAVTGIVQAVFQERTISPICALILLALVTPSLLRGARTGYLSGPASWLIALVAVLVPLVATIGLRADRSDYLTVGWYVAATLTVVALLLMAARPAPGGLVAVGLVLHTAVWGGPVAVLRLGVAAALVVLGAGLLVHRTVHLVAERAQQSAVKDRETALWQVEQEAFHLERQIRLHLAGRDASPMLQRVIDTDGDLDELSRVECRVLEQTIRDEIRGRRLLNDPVRAAVHAHRARGARVQVLDDGGLDEMAPAALNRLLNTLAMHLAPLQSTNIVIRTAQRDSPTAITVVATTIDEVAAALGLEDDDRVDLWLELPRNLNHPLQTRERTSLSTRD